MANCSIDSTDVVKRPDTFIIVIFISGFSCFLAWPLITVLSASLPDFAAGPSSDLNASQLAALAGALLMLLCSLLAPVSKRLDSWRRSNVLSFVMAAVMIAFPLCVFSRLAGTAIPYVLELVLWFLEGTSFALLLLHWGGAWDLYVHAYGKKDIAVNLLSSVVIVALVCAVCAYALSSFFLVALAVVSVFSLAACRCFTFLASKDAGSEPKTLDGIVKLPPRQASFVVVISSYGSFALFLCAGTIGGTGALAIVAAALLIACIALTAVRALKGTAPRFLSVERISFPLAVSGTLAAPFIDWPIAMVGMAFVSILGVSAFMISHWEMLVNWSSHFKLQSIYHYSYGTFTLAGGSILGAITSSLVLMDFLPITLSASAVCIVALLCVVIISAFSPYDSEPVFDSFEGGITKTHEHKGIWKATVEDISQHNQLTPREKEVFEYLAKGRSVKYISAKLVISEHTTKTHVYRIYKKLEINGQQELLDMVEENLAQAKKAIVGER
ncbi:response regulator transcription factor [Gordonibacter massiliensis (ex Traore et al. 2017)]|uniref:response regulator transcription factor n=1 Tax=Gordonibacter massiliensis (ex Traore et al. 2017) TaxID=1841863 RepID=UPI001C8B7FEF|nr:helix-turn-helix transcriptional regulator [Gordonibacter massiliensis (ex Traore et al. 2017)]MBX9032418.1 helix-turn-helix transcriptional regulator [Gordonibacter massiliensis (ex Traore et al. 2017)]